MTHPSREGGEGVCGPGTSYITECVDIHGNNIPELLVSCMITTNMGEKGHILGKRAHWKKCKMYGSGTNTILTLSDPGFWIFVITPRGRGVLRTNTYILACWAFLCLLV